MEVWIPVFKFWLALNDTRTIFHTTHLGDLDSSICCIYFAPVLEIHFMKKHCM